MELTAKSELGLKVFKIPIEIYEKCINTELSKEKKKEIFDLFANCNYLHSKEEFKAIKYYLNIACKEGNVELIKILLSETIEDESHDLQFKIDKTSKTASLFGVNKRNLKQLIIPRTVKHDSTDYLITSISCIRCNSIKSIKFAEDSAIETIYGQAFPEFSILEEIHFPGSLSVLGGGWCSDLHKLKKIIISPSNDKFIFKDDKLLLGKSDQSKDEFDIIYFAHPETKEISIPSTISKISEYSFSFCRNLSKVEIPTNSNLQTIGKFAFWSSIIGEIYFPASLNDLEEGWCHGMNYLRKIIISPLNDKFIFKDDKSLLGKSDQSKDEFDILLFACRDIKEISIPSTVKVISSYAFNHCVRLEKVEIPANSSLQKIEQNAFSWSTVKELFIPPTVSKIGKCAFMHCSNLTKVELPENSNLETIEDFVFQYSSIKEIFIPPRVTKICRCAFSNCSILKSIEIPMNSNLQTIESCAFSSSKIREIYFPAGLNKSKM